MKSDKMQNFNAFAIWSGDSKPLPNLAPATVTGGQGGWTYGPPKQLWPQTGTIDFYAYSPDDATTPTYLTAHYNATDYTPAHLYISYTVPTPPSDLAQVSPQQDLLVAVKPDVSCNTPGPVTLNFQHALSRIQLKARPAIAGAKYVVNRVKFLNLSNEGNLALSTANIPDEDGFDYDDVLPHAPLVLWTDHNAKTTDYEFSWTTPVEVFNHAAYSNIITGNDAFVILPQTTELGDIIPIADFVDATNPADPADSKFYVRIDFAPEGNPTDVKVKYFAVREPLDPAKNEPLSFEAGRSYTFIVDLSGSDYIEFANVEIHAFNEAFTDSELPEIDITPDPNPVLTADAYMPAPNKGFAGSNIYWDSVNERLTFGDVGDTSNETNQGLYFKWGSLVGISPVGNWDATTVLYTPTGINGAYEATTADAYAAGDWTQIAAAAGTRNFDAGQDPIVGVDDLRLSGYVSYLNTLPAELAAFKGDICAYLSGRPGIPEGFWRLPTSAEFEYGTYDPLVPFVSPGAYDREGSVNDKGTPDRGDDEFLWTAGASDQIDGTFSIANGYRLEYASGKYAFFPASGSRNNSTGALNELGLRGYAWSSSPYGANGRYLSFNAPGVNPAYSSNRARGFAVRCVKK
jgi:hypothetical protein